MNKKILQFLDYLIRQFIRTLQTQGCLFITIIIFFMLFILCGNISIFYNSKGEFQWSSITAFVAVIAIVINNYITIRNSDKTNHVNLILKDKQEWIDKTIDAVIELQKSYRWILRSEYTSERGKFSEEKEKSYAEFQGAVSKLKFLFIIKNSDSLFEKKENPLDIKGSMSQKTYHYDVDATNAESRRVKKANEKNSKILSVLKKPNSNDSKIPVIIDLLNQLFENIDEVGVKGKSEKYQTSSNYMEYQEYLDKLVAGISLFVAIEKKKIEEEIKL